MFPAPYQDPPSHIRRRALRQRTKQFLTVDFVTALPLDECLDRLRTGGDQPHQDVTIVEDSSIAIRRIIPKSSSEITFWGTLEPFERGSWVWGTVFEERREGVQTHPWILVFVVIVILFMGLEALLRNAFSQAAIWLAILLVLGLIALVRWYWRYRHGLAMVEWIYELLYIPPQRDKK